MKKFLVLVILYYFNILRTEAQCFSTQTFNAAGSFTYTIPQSGCVKITAVGAGGGNALQGDPDNFGGDGATIVGRFYLTAGDVLDIYVGDNAETTISSGAGGGGGTAVILNDAKVLIAAGGGGGAALNHDGQGGQNNTNSVAGGGLGLSAGGGGGFNINGGNPEGGGAGTLTGQGTGGIAGTPGIPISTPGGNGWGAGGGSVSNSDASGGGGGYKGGDSSPGVSQGPSKGGDSYVHPFGWVVSATAGGSTGSLSEGSVIIECLVGIPVYNSSDTTYYCSLDDALAAGTLNDGDILELPAGTYTSGTCFLIDKSITIKSLGFVTLNCLELNGSSKTMKLDGNLNVTQLTLTDGKIRTDGFNLSCGTITGGDPASYIITD